MWPFSQTIKPQVGMRLEDRTWGDYTTIEVVRVSKDYKTVLFKYVWIYGKPGTGEFHEFDWIPLHKQFYRIINENSYK